MSSMLKSLVDALDVALGQLPANVALDQSPADGASSTLHLNTIDLRPCGRYQVSFQGLQAIWGTP